MANDFEDLLQTMNSVADEIEKTGKALDNASGKEDAVKLASDELNIQTFSEGAILNDVPMTNDPDDAISPKELEKAESNLIIDVEVLMQGIATNIEKAAK